MSCSVLSENEHTQLSHWRTNLTGPCLPPLSASPRFSPVPCPDQLLSQRSPRASQLPSPGGTICFHPPILSSQSKGDHSHLLEMPSSLAWLTILFCSPLTPIWTVPTLLAGLLFLIPVLHSGESAGYQPWWTLLSPLSTVWGHIDSSGLLVRSFLLAFWLIQLMQCACLFCNIHCLVSYPTLSGPPHPLSGSEDSHVQTCSVPVTVHMAASRVFYNGSHTTSDN